MMAAAAVVSPKIMPQEPKGRLDVRIKRPRS